MNSLKLLDTFAGLGTFSLVAKKCQNIETICTSEIDPFKIKLIDKKLKLDNAGDIRNLGISMSVHPHRKYQDSDLVAVEETGFTTLTIEDFYSGAISFPDILTGGFPCKEISPSNLKLNHLGIKGDNSSLVDELLRLFEDLEPKYGVLENSELLTRRGLDYILKEFTRLGYVAEYETVSAANFGFNHYRHRVILFVYRPDTAIANNNIRVFDRLRENANKKPDCRMPLMKDTPQSYIDSATVLDTRSIKLRTKRINALGDAVIPDLIIPIFEAIIDAEKVCKHFNDSNTVMPRNDEELFATLDTEGWGCIKKDLFDEKIEYTNIMPSRGLMIGGKLFSGNIDRKLNPAKSSYKSMYSTLLSRDGNNNFTTKSRLNRSGKLGGLVGDFMRLGANAGGLNPTFCEEFLHFPRGITDLASPTNKLD